MRLKHTFLLRNSLLFLAAAGCTEFDVTAKNNFDDLQNDGVPVIIVDPVIINFPNLDASADLEATEVVTVTNEGTNVLKIDEIYLEDANLPFIIQPISSPLITPGGQEQFSITFAPDTAANNVTNALISSNDPSTPIAAVQLNGVGVAPVIDISPINYDFGTLYIGCDDMQELTIKNVGTADLVISNFSFASASSDIKLDTMESSYGSLPWTIAPDDTRKVVIDYRPLDGIQDDAF